MRKRGAAKIDAMLLNDKHGSHRAENPSQGTKIYTRTPCISTIAKSALQNFNRVPLATAGKWQDDNTRGVQSSFPMPS